MNLDQLYKKSLTEYSAKTAAIKLGLIQISELQPEDYNLVLYFLTKELEIKKDVLKEIPAESLFKYAKDNGCIKEELIERIKKEDFQLPSLDIWTKYDLPVTVQKLLVQHLVNIELKQTKRWYGLLKENIQQQIRNLRKQKGIQKATQTRKNTPKLTKEQIQENKIQKDPIYQAIKNNNEYKFSYFNLEQLAKDRFNYLISYWLKSKDEIRCKILKTSYVNQLNEQQYIQVLKSWLNVSYNHVDIPELKLETFKKLPTEYQYKAIDKFAHDDIENIVPLPDMKEIKQIILPELITDPEDAEELFLKYRRKVVIMQIKQNAGIETPDIKDLFDEEETKKLKTIRTVISIDSYKYSTDDLKFEIEFYDWVLSLEEKKKQCICSYLVNKKDSD